ncbi:MAG: DNA internalization-related competence protein ComEC/Rec2 [Candidatus Eremiobacteraeota bacterium]|nr:DNA internalization-related competence protein ComEC/Rec2 [Candidatus Eremiobacteraeota bacterium]
MGPASLVPFAVAFACGTLLAETQELGVRSLALLVFCGAMMHLAFGGARWALLASAIVALAIGTGNACLHQQPAGGLKETHTRLWQCRALQSWLATGGPHIACALKEGVTLDVPLTTDSEIPSPGELLVVRGRLEPFDGARNPGEPDAAAVERERGLDARLDGATIVRRTHSSTFNLRVEIARAQRWSTDTLRTQLAEPYATILAGELLGQRDALPLDLREEFQTSGTVHILVTAGLHIGLVAALSAWLLGALGLPRAWLCAAVGTVVWGYAMLSGAHLPALRAATMLGFGLLARAYGAAALTWNAYAAAALAILFFDPAAVSSVSFALSFSCVGAILLFAPTIDAAVERRAALPERLREVLTLSVATQLGVWPLTAATFLQFTPYSVVANVLVVPFVPLTMLLGIAQLCLAPFATLAGLAANLNSWLLSWIVAVVRTSASLPLAHVVMTPAPPWCIALYDAVCLAVAVLASRGARTLAAAAAIVGIGYVLAPPREPRAPLRITVLDVGQADAIVVQTPSGRTLLVDAGGRLERGRAAGDSAAEDVGTRIVVPFLIRAGIHHVDALLVSHPHGDHVGGGAPVLRMLGADVIADSGQRYGGFAYHDMLGVAQADRTPIVYPRAGTVWRTGDGVTLRFFSPELPLIAGTRNDINNNSLVFMLEYKHFRMLFTGDAGAEAEQRILAEGVDLHADVLKVGHHGSAYGSTPAFIAAVRPRYAIISVGRHNLFGHPAPLTIATLQRYGAHIYRTDKDGAIVVETDGTAVTMSTTAR